MVAIDLPCRACGYNLRGLVAEGRCPECGGAVPESMGSDLLRFAPARYVQALADGVDWVLIGVTVQVAALLLVGGIGVALTLMTGGGSSAADDAAAAAAMVSLFAGFAGGLALLVGVWLVATPDPAGYETPLADLGRGAVRWGISGSIVGVPLIVMAAFVLPRDPAEFVTILSFYLLLGGAVAIVAGYFAQFAHIARRVPSARIARSGRMLSVLVLSAFGMAWLLLGVELVLAWVGAPPTMAPLGPLARALLALVAIVCFVWGLSVHVRLRKPLHEQARLAQRRWPAV